MDILLYAAGAVTIVTAVVYYLTRCMPTDAERFAQLQHHLLAVDLRVNPCHITWGFPGRDMPTRIPGAQLYGLVHNLQLTLEHMAVAYSAYMTAPPETPLRKFIREVGNGVILGPEALSALEKELARCRRLRWEGRRPYCAGARLVGELRTPDVDILDRQCFDVTILELRHDNI